MSRAADLGGRVPDEAFDPDSITIGITTVCEECGAQPDEVKYNRLRKLLFWECPNGHKGWIEDFELYG